MNRSAVVRGAYARFEARPGDEVTVTYPMVRFSHGVKEIPAMRREIPEQTGITPSARIYGPGNVLDKMPKAVQSRGQGGDPCHAAAPIAGDSPRDLRHLRTARDQKCLTVRRYDTARDAASDAAPAAPR